MAISGSPRAAGATRWERSPSTQWWSNDPPPPPRHAVRRARRAAPDRRAGVARAPSPHAEGRAAHADLRGARADAPDRDQSPRRPGAPRPVRGAEELTRTGDSEHGN